MSPIWILLAGCVEHRQIEACDTVPSGVIDHLEPLRLRFLYAEHGDEAGLSLGMLDGGVQVAHVTCHGVSDSWAASLPEALVEPLEGRTETLVLAGRDSVLLKAVHQHWTGDYRTRWFVRSHPGLGGDWEEQDPLDFVGDWRPTLLTSHPEHGALLDVSGDLYRVASDGRNLEVVSTDPGFVTFARVADDGAAWWSTSDGLLYREGELVYPDIPYPFVFDVFEDRPWTVSFPEGQVVVTEPDGAEWSWPLSRPTTVEHSSMRLRVGRQGVWVGWTDDLDNGHLVAFDSSGTPTVELERGTSLKALTQLASGRALVVWGDGDVALIDAF